MGGNFLLFVAFPVLIFACLEFAGRRVRTTPALVIAATLLAVTVVFVLLAGLNSPIDFNQPTFLVRVFPVVCLMVLPAIGSFAGWVPFVGGSRAWLRFVVAPLGFLFGLLLGLNVATFFGAPH